MQILITSPIPTHPASHGNRARVKALAEALKARGHILHFVYTGFEGLDENQEDEMRRLFDHLYLLEKPDTRRPKPRFKHHGIDDWYPRELDSLTQSILATWRIEACIANYVWCSRWLKYVPKGIARYIDTHDRFANRHATLKAAGMEPDWYSTSSSGEAKALRRADRVFAIQSEEAVHFENLARTPVDVIGHLVPAQRLAARSPLKPPYRLGYLGSNNGLNQHAIAALADNLARKPIDPQLAELHLAGPISETPVARSITNAKRHGFVDSPAGFYADMDIILNPHIEGTGLKIKTIEALAYGKPVIATRWAMIGIKSERPEHQTDSIDAFRQALDTLLMAARDNPDVLLGAARASFEVYDHYAGQLNATLDQLFPPEDCGAAL